MEIYPKTRREALMTGAKRYFTGKPCKHGHISERFPLGNCVACSKAYLSTETVRKKRAKQAREYQQKNPESTKAKSDRWKALHPERVAAHKRKYWMKHADRLRAKALQIAKIIRQDPLEKAKRSAYQRAREARKLKAMPPMDQRA